ncbi:MAG: hypothetical protein DI616_04130 [Paracoccus denitrificans]|uniref:Uncharacterized protein n=1 Tax=Paracoccus denitrificans TaxID=266 RepID=A0A533IER1_PARDE|nr:MAG: hypothetical protein DI616_04130 [Paracoccus denitrificans]
MAEKVERLVGDGWELGVFRQQGKLVLGVPVESGFKNFGFEFEIGPQDLAVLKRDAHRRKALDLILHDVLQPRLTCGDHGGTASEVLPIIATVLHGTADQLEQAISSAANPGYIRQKLREAGLTDR